MAVTPETEIVAGIGNDYKYGFQSGSGVGGT